MKYVIGIDLGTTNSALAYAEIRPDADPFDTPEVALLAIPQLVNPGEVRDEPLLPSSLYLPGATDFPAGSLALPGMPSPNLSSAAWRRSAAWRTPAAWCRRRNRGSRIPAWTAPRRFSPGVRPKACRSSRRSKPRAAISNTCADAWDAKMPDAPFTEQQVLVTVPASFDAVARELTLEAAEQAGYRNVTLLEEPQAAFYAWIERHPDWRERVKLGDLILVVDIGGGTTDFTLIAVTEQRGRTGARARGRRRAHPAGRRQYGSRAGPPRSPAQLAEKGTRIDSLQLHALWHNCRVAKEKLLEPGSQSQRAARHDSRQRHGPGRRHDQSHAAPRGRRSRARRGLLPAVSSSEMPQRQRRMGLQEIGLPYAADAAITKHMAQFLRQQASSAEHGASAAAQRSRRAHARSVQRRRAPRAPGSRPPHRSAQLLARGGRLRPGPASQRRRPDARRLARRGLLRSGAPRPRRAHSRRRAAHLLRRYRERHARRPRHARAAQGSDRRPVRHGGRNIASASPIASSALSSASPPSSASSRPAVRKNDRPAP